MLHQNTNINFLFIRHGESEANLKPQFLAQQSGSKLSTKGWQQAEKLGKRLAQEVPTIDYVYSSTMRRAIETAEGICQYIDFQPSHIIKTDELVEFSQGEWGGKLRKQIYTTDTLRYINTKGAFFIPPEGESQRMVERRASQWLEDEILYNPLFYTAPKSMTVAVVAHGVTLKCLFHYIMGFNDRLIYKMTLDNYSLSRFSFNHEGWSVGALNDAWHIRETTA